MRVIARYPRLAAWIVSLALVGAGTFGGMLGLQALEPAIPANLAHAHGFIVAMRPNGWFAMQIPGHTGMLWFEPAPGASISPAHLLRHLHEHAPTDVFYQLREHGVLLAWDAD